MLPADGFALQACKGTYMSSDLMLHYRHHLLRRIPSATSQRNFPRISLARLK